MKYLFGKKFIMTSNYFNLYQKELIPIFNIIQLCPLLFVTWAYLHCRNVIVPWKKTISLPVTIQNQQAMKSGMYQGCRPLHCISRLSYCLHYLHIVVLPDGQRCHSPATESFHIRWKILLGVYVYIFLILAQICVVKRVQNLLQWNQTKKNEKV